MSIFGIKTIILSREIIVVKWFSFPIPSSFESWLYRGGKKTIVILYPLGYGNLGDLIQLKVSRFIGIGGKHDDRTEPTVTIGSQLTWLLLAGRTDFPDTRILPKSLLPGCYAKNQHYLEGTINT
jgi:hypothetical protein